MLVWGIFLSAETLVVAYKGLPVGMIQSLDNCEATYKRYLQYFLSYGSHERKKNTLTERSIAQVKQRGKIYDFFPVA